jgi:hypothetical protein
MEGSLEPDPAREYLLYCLFTETSGSQWDVVYRGWPIAPSYVSPNGKGGGVRGVSQSFKMGVQSIWKGPLKVLSSEMDPAEIRLIR